MKHKLRLAVVPILARVERILGKTWKHLGEKYGREVMLAQASEILASSEYEQPNIPFETLDIIFLTMIGGHAYNTAVDVVLGLALKARGHRVRFVVCDQQLPACEVKKANNKNRWQRSCDKCWAYGQNIFAKFGLEIIRVSDLVKDQQQPSDLSRWTETVEASLLKHFGVGVLEANEAVTTRRKAYLASVGISHTLGVAVIALNPDRVVMSHGIYSTWGPQRELLNDAGIPVVTYSKCKKQHTEKFNWSTSADWWDVSEEWNRVKDTPLTEAQNARLDEYLSSRRDHSADTLKYNFGAEQTKHETFARLGLDETKPTFVAFTNVLWDAASAQREIVFSDPIEWIIDTISWFAERPELQLVVKIHPAEVVIGTNQPFAKIISDRIRNRPPNVCVIEPHEKVNSWSIMQIADLGLVHTSTIGMEMPLESVPCAVVSKTHFRSKGFTFDVATREEYFDLIETWNRNEYDIHQMKELARRYAYILFERYQLPFKFFHEPSHTDVRAMNFTSIANLSAHPTIKLIVQSIETKQEFLMPSAPEEITAFWAPVS